jgi:hypothetical protein
MTDQELQLKAVALRRARVLIPSNSTGLEIAPGIASHIGIWEQIHNPNFKGIESETFKNQAGLNSFSLTPRKWIEATHAIGFQSRAGRYGGGILTSTNLKALPGAKSSISSQ